MFRNVLLMSAAALAFNPGAAFAQDASAALKRASDAMGAGELKSIRYADTLPWPSSATTSS